MKLQEITAIKQYTLELFVDAVNKKLDEGWELHGDAKIAFSTAGEIYAYVQILRRFKLKSYTDLGT